MEYRVHMQRCEHIVESEEFSELSDFFKGEVNRQVNRWMDWFFGFKGNLHGVDYDYSDYSQDHRRERHHAEGIVDAGHYIASMYGESYRTLAEKIARQHILDDFDRVPNRRELQ